MSDAARSVTVVVNNNSDAFLTFQASTWQLYHGIWSQGLFPPSVIAPGTQGTFEAESQGLWTGTQGRCYYLFQDGVTVIVIEWDNPYDSSNLFNAPIVGPLQNSYQATFNQPQGDNVAFTIDLS